MDSLNEISDMFMAESTRLKNQIDYLLVKPDLGTAEIIDTYHQIMNVSSILTILKQQISGKSNPKMLEKIQETETLISEKFNSDLHPRIIQKFSNSIENAMKILKPNNSEKKSRDDVEKEAKLYEELRQTMSAKEFVEQYDKELSNV